MAGSVHLASAYYARSGSTMFSIGKLYDPSRYQDDALIFHHVQRILVEDDGKI